MNEIEEIKEGRPNYEKIMEQWDEWRKYISEGGTASWPRDAFENLIGWYEEHIATLLYGLESKDKEIEELKGQIKYWKEKWRREWVK